MEGWEDEPRDDHGRWTEGGSAGPSQHPNASADAHGVNEKMKETGVPNQWGTNRNANVREAEKIAKAQGYETSVYRKPGSLNAAVYSDGKIHINASHGYWKDPVGVAAHNEKIGHLSTGNPEGIIHHEIGHALYDPPDNFMNQMRERELITKHVSKYAARNPKEFVSEVHAGTKAGKKYDENIMRMFHNYARPRTHR